MRNLTITLRYDSPEYVLENPIPEIDEHSTDEEKSLHAKHVDDSNKFSRIMLATMSLDLQKTFKHAWDYEKNMKLAKLFQQREKQELFEVTKSFTPWKLKEDGSICVYGQLMNSYIDKHEKLDLVFNENLVLDLVLGSLPISYDNFIMSYHLKSVDKKLIELYNLLQIAETCIKKFMLTN